MAENDYSYTGYWIQAMWGRGFRLRLMDDRAEWVHPDSVSEHERVPQYTDTATMMLENGFTVDPDCGCWSTTTHPHACPLPGKNRRRTE